MLTSEVAMRSVDTEIPGRAGFTPAEWGTLVRLPGQVVVAATAAPAADRHRTVAGGLAGLDAIAAGRASGNDLVRHVVATIYAERDDGAAFVDVATDAGRVVAACQQAAGILAARCGPVDRDAYRAWIASIAARVCGAPWPGRDGRFLADVTVALRGYHG
jgi:hypothetical protein